MPDTDQLLSALAFSISARGRMVVTSAAPAAASVGIAALMKGGNAYDAAVAACLVEGVALPMKCGLGGDIVAIVWEAGGSPEAMVSVGRGCELIGSGRLPTVTGGASIGAPGAAQGYAALAARGRLGLAELVAPAIELAEDGVPWSDYAVKLTHESADLLRRSNEEPLAFLPAGEVPAVGDRLRLPNLAQLYREFAQAGAGLWQGDCGLALLWCVERAGGILSQADLAKDLVLWSAAESVDLQGGASQVWATPNPTHGANLLEALKRTVDEGRDPVEAVREIRRRSGKAKTAAEFAGTSVVTAADAEGNAVVIVHSNSFPQYGSGVVVPDFSLVLNNRPGRGFVLDDPQSVNAPAPDVVPAVTLHAWAASKGSARMLGATPGGINQLPWNLQTLRHLLDDKEPAAAILEPRWQLALGAQDRVLYESGHAQADGDARPALSMRSASQILHTAASGAFWNGVADPRTGAVAIGA